MKYLISVGIFVLSLGTASAQSIGGSYEVAGKNFDGTPYSGTAEITLTSQTTCVIEWDTAGVKSEGICMRNDDAFSAAYVLEGEIGLVTYKVDENGKLNGLWTLAGKEGNGSEVLTPAQ